MKAFWGAISPIEAELYLQAIDPSVSLLGGRIAGPFSEKVQTLSAEYALRPCTYEGQETLKVTVSDPCFWAPGSPFLYRAEVLCANEADERKESLHLGICPLTIHGRDLFHAGRRMVMRIVEAPHAVNDFEGRETLLDSCVETGSVLLLSNPEASICARAAQKGVLLVVQISLSDPQQVIHALESLSSCPAVGMVILSADLIFNFPLSGGVASLIRGMVCDPSSDQKMPAWAQVLIVDENGLQRNDSPIEKLPQMVSCQIDSETPTRVARGLCDDLQRRTVAWPRMAGYIVTSAGTLY